MVGKVTRIQEARAAGSSVEAAAASTPGKRALTDDLARVHATPPRRVAEATAEQANAVIKVVAYSKGKLLGIPWGAKGRWEGPLPQRYTGTRSAAGWTWNNAAQRTEVCSDHLCGEPQR
jgi:hypothetical protein